MIAELLSGLPKLGGRTQEAGASRARKSTFWAPLSPASAGAAKHTPATATTAASNHTDRCISFPPRFGVMTVREPAAPNESVPPQAAQTTRLTTADPVIFLLPPAGVKAIPPNPFPVQRKPRRVVAPLPFAEDLRVSAD